MKILSLLRRTLQDVQVGCQTRVIWEGGVSDEKMPRSGWPVGKSGQCFCLFVCLMTGVRAQPSVGIATPGWVVLCWRKQAEQAIRTVSSKTPWPWPQFWLGLLSVMDCDQDKCAT